MSPSSEIRDPEKKMKRILPNDRRRKCALLRRTTLVTERTNLLLVCKVEHRL
jgi:hypothetical protein